MRAALSLSLVCLTFAGGALAQERSASPHIHGESELSIVIDGSAVALSLSAPGADIVGIEHLPETGEQRAALDRALAALADPLSLFTPDTTCTLDDADIHAEALGIEASETHAEHQDHAHEAGHASIEAEYRLTCSGSITQLGFGYFDVFPAAMEVHVQVLADGMAAQHVVTRETPTLVIGH